MTDPSLKIMDLSLLGSVSGSKENGMKSQKISNGVPQKKLSFSKPMTQPKETIRSNPPVTQHSLQKKVLAQSQVNHPNLSGTSLAQKQVHVTITESRQGQHAISANYTGGGEGKGGGVRGFDMNGPAAQRSVISMVKPEYPDWAAEQGIETEVSLKFWVNPLGEVKQVQIEKRSGYLELDMIARRALQQWKFDSLSSSASQKDQWGTVVIKYRLE